MTCDEILTRLDAWADEGLAPAEQAAVDAHLAGCDRCRAEAHALRALLAEARALPRAVLPARDLWGGIAPRLTAPEPHRVPPSETPLRQRLLASRPLLLAAAIGGILLGVMMASLWQRQGELRAFTAERARYVEASTALARALAADPTTLNPETRAVVERTLSILDQAIAEAEAALEKDPRNTELEQMLLARYEQRLGLLRRAAATGRSVS